MTAELQDDVAALHTTTGPSFQNVRGEHIESTRRLPQQMTGLRPFALLGAMTEVGNGLLLNVF